MSDSTGDSGTPPGRVERSVVPVDETAEAGQPDHVAGAVSTESGRGVEPAVEPVHRSAHDAFLSQYKQRKDGDTEGGEIDPDQPLEDVIQRFGEFDSRLWNDDNNAAATVALELTVRGQTPMQPEAGKPASRPIYDVAHDRDLPDIYGREFERIGSLNELFDKAGTGDKQVNFTGICLVDWTPEFIKYSAPSDQTAVLIVTRSGRTAVLDALHHGGVPQPAMLDDAPFMEQLGRSPVATDRMPSKVQQMWLLDTTNANPDIEKATALLSPER